MIALENTGRSQTVGCGPVAIALSLSLLQVGGISVLVGVFCFNCEMTRREPSKMASTKANLIGNLVSDLTSIQK